MLELYRSTKICSPLTATCRGNQTLNKICIATRIRSLAKCRIVGKAEHPPSKSCSMEGERVPKQETLFPLAKQPRELDLPKQPQIWNVFNNPFLSPLLPCYKMRKCKTLNHFTWISPFHIYKILLELRRSLRRFNAPGLSCDLVLLTQSNSLALFTHKWLFLCNQLILNIVHIEHVFIFRSKDCCMSSISLLFINMKNKKKF